MTLIERRTDSTFEDAESQPTDSGPVLNPWIPAAVIIAGTVMVILDGTIVNIALHQIGTSLHAGTGIEWVVTAYLLAVCASQPVTGWLADRVGRRRVYLWSLGAFTTASVLCAMAPNLPLLVAARAVQGLGGGALMPVGMAMILHMFPREKHGRAVATWGMASMVAPALGPTVGGWLITAVSWHWLFIINAPIGIVCLALAFRLLPRGGHREERPFDFPGLVLGSGGLAVTVLGLSQANQWGWGSPETVGCIAIGVTMLVTFIRHELSSPHPMIQLRMFSERTFRLAMSLLFFVTFAQFGRMVFMALELEDLRGYTPLKVGLMFLPSALVTAVSMQIGGRLVDRIGPRTPIMVGCALMCGALLGLGTLGLDSSATLITLILAFQGLGMGLIGPSSMVVGLSALPPALLSQGTAVRSLGMQVSGAVAIAILGAVVAARMGTNPTDVHAQAAYNTAFLFAAAGLLVSFFFASRLPRGVTEIDPELEAEALALAGE